MIIVKLAVHEELVGELSRFMKRVSRLEPVGNRNNNAYSESEDVNQLAVTVCSASADVFRAMAKTNESPSSTW